MSRIYQSVSNTVYGIGSYLPFGKKKAEPVKDEDGIQPVVDNKSPLEADTSQQEKANDKKTSDQDVQMTTTNDQDTPSTNEDDKGDDGSELPSNKKTDEVFDPQNQPGFLRRAAGGVVNTATGAVSLGVGGVKWVGSTAYSTTSAVVTTTTGVIKKVPQVIKRKDKKE